MGLVAKIISFARNSFHNVVKADIGGGDILQGEHFSAAGDDSPPLRNDYGLCVRGLRAGSVFFVGYSDMLPKVSAPGEVRRYARGPDGAVVAEVYMQNDGSIEITNDLGTFTLMPDGSVDINGAVIDIAGNLTCTSVTAPIIQSGAVILGVHTHAGGTVPPPDGGG